MAMLPLRKVPDPILRAKAKRVRNIDGSIRKLVEDMIDTMRDASGVGLAAPQVGVPLRVIVIKVPEEEEERVLINPQVIKRMGEREVSEGCLSIPGYKGELKRSVTVRVKGMDLEGNEVRIKAQDLLAQALEHETDHINGILYTDHLESMDKLYELEPEETETA